ncbi:hypothetical protein VNO78_31240 [Psophocarpus tetragonolobus]|uniref:Uncharacterized protein n=1 Tax=Psophocarpus tetragonolobus TaxID=3891 RepID=A0AAN9RYY5_PSOTE
MAKMKKKEELIFFPIQESGHLPSFLELAQILINRHNNLSITILRMKLPYAPSSDAYIRTVTASQPQIRAIDLPHVEPPPQELIKRSLPLYIWTFLEILKPHVKATLQNILSSRSSTVIGLVIDVFCLPLIDVGNDLGIPSYLFNSSNVGLLSLMHSLKKRQIDDVFNGSEPEWLLPGFHDPVPSGVLPGSVFNKEGGYAVYYKMAQRFKDSKGIIVNTFSELEQDAVDALLDSQIQLPPIYAVGPLINLKGQPNPNLDQAQHEKILKWLDEQPSSSVVYLCFGSKGSFDPSQTREIALALQLSGVRFLWSMRSPPNTDNKETMLPEGFLECIEGRGMLCEWTLQVEILAHKAIVGFVSHCGWNSILESMWFGVPILTWPIYGEQQLNAYRMVREFGLAVELKLDYRRDSDLVVAEKIEKGLQQLMDRGNKVHKKVKEMKQMARKAILNGGSSFISVGELIDVMTVVTRTTEVEIEALWCGRSKKMGSTDDMKKKPELILLPSPGIGHLVSSIEFAQLLINRDQHLSITILCINFPFTPFSVSYIRSALASQPKIKLIDLPFIEPPPHELLLKSPEHYIFTFMESLKPHVKTAMQDILSSYLDSESHPVVGLVLDIFCLSMVDVGDELGIPSYMFMTSNIAFTSFMLSLLQRGIEDVFTDSDPEWLVPGFIDPIPPSSFPDAVLNKDGGYAAYYKLAQRFMDTKGIIVNSFSEVERYALDALCDGPSQIPSIYAVGPLIDLKGLPNPNLDQAMHDKILKWLDEQPPSSVVFLCFGSMGSFGPSQTREIAQALERSGVRFLWAMRSPPTIDNADKTLPDGFLEWMDGKGMICGWAPQVEVLAHKAIGGFVSHCGWNSLLESLWFGVPTLTWPIYAEQQLNAFWMVRFGLAVELRLDYRKGSHLVMAEEIEKGLKQLMDRNNVVHKNVKEMKEKARKAVLTGGSSYISVGKLIDNMMENN